MLRLNTLYRFSKVAAIATALTMALPMLAQAQSCTCTCSYTAGGGPVTRAIPTYPSGDITLAETQDQCQTVCATQATTEGGTAPRGTIGSCTPGLFDGAATTPTSTGTGGTDSLPGSGGSVPLYNPLGTDIGVAEFISRGIRTVIGFVGALALLMFVYGGVMWMTAGDSKRIDTAKQILKNSTIGLLLIFFSYSLVSIVFSLLGGS